MSWTPEEMAEAAAMWPDISRAIERGKSKAISACHRGHVQAARKKRLVEHKHGERS